MAIAVIDYNMGNLGSVEKALAFAGAEVEVIGKAADLAAFDRCILPGVGNFGDGMENLRQRGFDRAIETLIGRGGAMLGICLGMQMLLEASDEAPGIAGLGVFPGTVRRFPDGVDKVPHMGWNSVEFVPGCPLADGLPSEPFFYFVHSFYVPENPQYQWARSCYILPFAPVIGAGRVVATQFHPEKSQRDGLRLIRNFLAWQPEL